MLVALKKAINKSLENFGYTITKKRPVVKNNRYTPPVLFEDMLEALHYHRGGITASFNCPLHKCVHRMGLNYFYGGWHPFVETLNEYKADNNLRYEESTLKKYYNTWQPVSAHQAYTGFNFAPEIFKKLPPHLAYLTPWSSRSVKRMDEVVRDWHKKDDEKHGEPYINMDEHGFRDYGPVADVKGQLEFLRLKDIYQSIDKNGYDRKHGDVNILVIKRGSDHRFIHKGGGYHRTAAMVALGYNNVPATFFEPWIISLDDIDYWPQVRKGIWEKESAARYFNHLFDFDSRSWAAEHNLIQELSLK